VNEKEYLDSIDASFPYQDESRWKATIDEGIRISPEAAYGALYEIFAAPPEIPVSDLERMMDYWSARFEHPLKEMVLKMTKAWVTGTGVPEAEVLSAMEMMFQYPGLYKALQLVAGPPLDWSEAVDNKYADMNWRWLGEVPEEQADGPDDGRRCTT
jgi:hypothetical protein